MEGKTNGDLSARDTQTTFNQPLKKGQSMKAKYTPCTYCGGEKLTAHPYCSDQCEHRHRIIATIKNITNTLQEIKNYVARGGK